MPGKLLGVRPFAGAGVAAHFLGADIPENLPLEDSIDGFRAGARTGAGVMTAQEGFGLRVQARRDFVDNAAAWSYTMGLGWWPHRHARGGYRLRAPQARYVTVAPVADSAAIPVETASRPTARPAAPATTLSPAALEQMAATTRTLQARIDSLERALRVRQTATTPAAVASPAPVAVPDPRVVFGQELERVARISGQPGAMRREADLFVLSLGGSLTFSTGSNTLDLATRETLRLVAALLLRNPYGRVVIEGHTDSVGSAERNRLLSLGRATAVHDELRRLGVAESRLGVEGYGESRPLGDNGTKEGRALNRRVDLRFRVEAPPR
jgi:outer membrane protein OmpA-like peptidoglycan-associated protein